MGLKNGLVQAQKNVMFLNPSHDKIQTLHVSRLAWPKASTAPRVLTGGMPLDTTTVMRKFRRWLCELYLLRIMGNYCTARRNDGPLHKIDTNGKWHALWHPCRGGICMTSSWYLRMNPKLWTEWCWSLQISCDPTLNGNLSWSLLNKDWELCFTPSTCRKTILPRPYYPEFRKKREPNTTNNDGFLYAKTQNVQQVASSCEFMHESKNPLHPCVVLGFPKPFEQIFHQAKTQQSHQHWLPWSHPGSAMSRSQLALHTCDLHTGTANAAGHLNGLKHMQIIQMRNQKSLFLKKKSHLRTDSTREIIFWQPGLPTFFVACLSCQ